MLGQMQRWGTTDITNSHYIRIEEEIDEESSIQRFFELLSKNMDVDNKVRWMIASSSTDPMPIDAPEGVLVRQLD